MDKDLKILIAEDYPGDYQLACQVLTRAGIKFSSRRVETAQDFRQALEAFQPDVVISDYHMPGFNGLEALGLCQQHDPFLPFIVLTGSVNEEIAVECMKKGASDYVLKDRIARLGFAVTDSLRLKNALRENQRAENQLRKLYTVTQQLPLTVVITDNKGVIEYANPFASKLTGYSPEELLGQNTRIFRSGLTPQSTYKELWDALLAGGEWQGRLLNRKKNGDLYWESASISAVLDEEGGLTHFAAIKEDITSRIHIEALEQELLAVKKAAQFKQNFLANMSHELRTPVTGIIGMADILSRTNLDEQQTDYLNTLKVSSQNLREIINQVLDFSKLEAGKLQLRKKPFPISHLVENAQKVFHSICSKELDFAIQVDKNLPRQIEADEPRISQVINNFLSNAVKFTARGGITMRVQQKEKLPDNQVLVMVGVEDTGVGISQKLQQSLFKPFSQLDQDHLGQIEGTGLGLAISKELAEMMDGSIGVESTPEKGSHFWFTFRAKIIDAESKAKQPARISKTNKEGLHILYAEDKAINQKVITLMLSSLGHKTTCANNGKEALKVYQPGTFDLILMDIQMPEMDGIACTRNLRESYTDLPPVVGLSANSLEGDKEKYLAMGLDEYLSKPVQTHELEALLNRMSFAQNLS